MSHSVEESQSHYEVHKCGHTRESLEQSVLVWNQSKAQDDSGQQASEMTHLIYLRVLKRKQSMRKLSRASYGLSQGEVKHQDHYNVDHQLPSLLRTVIQAIPIHNQVSYLEYSFVTNVHSYIRSDQSEYASGSAHT